MTKWLLGLVASAALAVALAGGGSGDAEAKKKKGKNKQCTYTNLLGQATSWRCKGNERCCYDAFMGKGTCSTAASCL